MVNKPMENRSFGRPLQRKQKS